MGLLQVEFNKILYKCSSCQVWCNLYFFIMHLETLSNVKSGITYLYKGVSLCVCAVCIFLSFSLSFSVHICPNSSSLAAAHCPEVISCLADTWDQWCGPSEEATAWQLALITFSTLRNSTLYMPLTSCTQCDPNSTIPLTLYTKGCVINAHTYTHYKELHDLTPSPLKQQPPADQHLPQSPRWEQSLYSGITWCKSDI